MPEFLHSESRTEQLSPKFDAKTSNWIISHNLMQSYILPQIEFHSLSLPYDLFNWETLLLWRNYQVGTTCFTLKISFLDPISCCHFDMKCSTRKHYFFLREVIGWGTFSLFLLSNMETHYDHRTQCG